MEEQIATLVQQWLQYDRFEHTRKEIQSLFEAKNFSELNKRLGSRIEFGTAGLRSRMAAGFSCMNELIIIQTTQGLCRYMEDVHQSSLDLAKQKGIVIGYDGRHNSKTYAQLTAAVFLSHGFKVYLFSKIACTPFVPFAVLQLKTLGGIMITASHNPKQDNGYKLYWDNGCQIVSPHDLEISQRIMQNLSIWTEVDITGESVKTSSLVEDPFDQIFAAYFEAVKQYHYLSKEENAKAEKVTFTAMHGVGKPFTAKAFEMFGLPEYIPVKQQIEIDPEFSTVTYPNPEEGKGALKLAMETAEANQSRLILANDPDADRLAVAERQKDGSWRIFNGNEIALLLANWSWMNFKQRNPNVDTHKCVMVASTVSSKILKSMARVEGFQFEETLTGFKWIGNKADEYVKRKQEGYHFIFGFEVEIGFAVGDMSLDKDGVRCAAIFYEMANYMYKQHDSLVACLDSLYSKYGYYLMKTRYFFTPTPQHVAKVMNKIRYQLTQGAAADEPSYPSSVGNGKYKIVNARDLTIGYETQSKLEGHRPSLPYGPSSQMITFTFDDESTCTLRNSGTEPKLKWYVEVHDFKSRQAAQTKLDELTKFVIDELLQPEKNELVAPSE